jgi:hypothetical protein
MCDGCHQQILKGRDKTIKNSKDQPMFHKPTNGFFEPMMDELNEWKLCVVEPSKNQFDEEEMNEVFKHALTYKSNQAIASIEVGKFGAIASEHQDAKGGFFLVKWKSTSYTLQDETEVFGCGLMLAGTVVVDGFIYHHLQGNNKGWFQPPDYEGPNMPYDSILHFRPQQYLLQNWAPLAVSNPIIDFIKSELQSREHLELYDVNGDDEQTVEDETTTHDDTILTSSTDSETDNSDSELDNDSDKECNP